MHVPDWFHRQLAAEFDGRLRIRWSPRRLAYLVEAKHARATQANAPVDPLDDEGIRRKDGYYLVMEVAPGDRLPCPRCRATVKIPILRQAEAKCPSCQKTWRASYWPLSESLLTHLRWSDPDRGGVDRVFTQTDADSERLVQARRRRLRNATEDVWKDAFPQVFDIPSVGYTGRERMLG